MLTFDHHRSSHRLVASRDQPVFVVLASDQELPVEISDIGRLRHGYPVVAPEVSGFPFNAALFVRLGRCTKLRFEAPVRTESHEASGLFPPMSAQDLLYRR